MGRVNNLPLRNNPIFSVLSLSVFKWFETDRFLTAYELQTDYTRYSTVLNSGAVQHI